MKRVVKDPAVRRQEIIQAARTLFGEQGYTSTPVEAIINRAGIAKGTFYYYFKSKRDLLSAIVEQISIDLQAYYTTILETPGVPVEEKLKRMLRGPEKSQVVDPDVLDILHTPENRELQERLNVQTIEVIAPLFAQVVEQGNEEGIFNAENPVEVVQVLLAGSQFLLDGGLFDWPPEKKLTLLRTIQVLFEMAIGAGPGTLNFISDTAPAP